MTVPSRIAIAFGLSFLLFACSTPSPQSLAEHDPWEKTNRDVFSFDVWIEHNIARPVDDAYRAVIPQPAREGVHNFTTNLHEPIVLANDVLQGSAGSAANTLGRILVNSTVGLAGLIDVAGRIGMPHHDNDFGITLGKSGVQEGSYLVLPFIGPQPPRDLVGAGVDGFFDPLSWARFHGKDTWMFGRGALRVMDVTDRRREEFETIERTSLDFYATTRNLYRQSRYSRIHGAEGAELPEF